MSPRIKVVQRIEDNRKRLEPVDVEFRILDIRMKRIDVDVWVEL